MRSFRFLIAAAFSLGALSAGATAQADEIGKVASISPQLQGTPPGQAKRSLSLGAAVHSGEVVRASASGRGQLLFVDQSTLTIAPRSEIVLDRFVYDPNGGAADVGLKLTKGALRFIGGKATRKKAAVIDTPTGTIGIRGSSGLVVVDKGRTVLIFVAGERACMTHKGKKACTNRRGGVLSEGRYLGKVSPAYLSKVLGWIDGAVPAFAPGRGGSGVPQGAPARRGPLSTTGESYDFGAPDGWFQGDVLTGIVRGAGPVVIDEETGDVVDPVDPGDPVSPPTGTSPCDDPVYVDTHFGGDYALCVIEIGY